MSHDQIAKGRSRFPLVHVRLNMCLKEALGDLIFFRNCSTVEDGFQCSVHTLVLWRVMWNKQEVQESVKNLLDEENSEKYRGTDNDTDRLYSASSSWKPLCTSNFTLRSIGQRD